jgi:hypothetical protein
MIRTTAFVSMLLACICLALLPAWADDEKSVKQEVKEDFKEAGRAIGGAARKVGQETKKVSKQVGKGVKKAAVTTGHAIRDGAKDLKETANGGDSESAAKTKEPRPGPR